MRTKLEIHLTTGTVVKIKVREYSIKHSRSGAVLNFDWVTPKRLIRRGKRQGLCTIQPDLIAAVIAR